MINNPESRLAFVWLLHTQTLLLWLMNSFPLQSTSIILFIFDRDFIELNAQLSSQLAQEESFTLDCTFCTLWASACCCIALFPWLWNLSGASQAFTIDLNSYHMVGIFVCLFAFLLVVLDTLEKEKSTVLFFFD